MAKHLEAKEKNDLLKEIAKAYYLGNVLNSDNHDRYSDIAKRSINVAETFVSSLQEALVPEPDKVEESAK